MNEILKKNVEFIRIKKNKKTFPNSAFFASKFRYLKTYHSYHLVDPSP